MTGGDRGRQYASWGRCAKEGYGPFAGSVTQAGGVRTLPGGVDGKCVCMRVKES